MADKALSSEECAQLEYTYASRRIVELELDPVRGKFDAAHLKEINRRIFQDLPGQGMTEVTPGVYRPAAPAGKDWMKNRGLETVDGSFYVAYSRMDEAAQARLNMALEGADPTRLRGLKTAEFTASIAALYAQLDYAHPFSDGNSRTLRVFTKQLAKESGYDIDWNRFAAGRVGRDLLYIARDRSVNAIAKPLAQDEATVKRLIYTMDRVQANRDLPDLLRDVVRPSRAVAFAKLPEADGVAAHPELAPAYTVLKTGAEYFASTIHEPAARAKALQAFTGEIQARLNAGEIAGFEQSRAPRPGAPEPSR